MPTSPGDEMHRQNDGLLDPDKQKEILWNKLKDQLESGILPSPSSSFTSSSMSNHQPTCPMKRKWPTYKEIMDDITNSDYNHVLECPHDMVHESRSKHSTSNDKHVKAFCPHGAVCCAELELFDIDGHILATSEGGPYTGLLAPGHKVQSIIRLSSAMKPPAKEQNKFGKFFLKATGGKLRHAKLFPMVALKCFRKGERSGNLLFAGRKIGQVSADFFQHCLCTQMTERVPGLLKPFIRKFYSYSENPLSLGVSDFCAQDGMDSESTNNFPYGE